jgi:SAM-dependent methyltransferase
MPIYSGQVPTIPSKPPTFPVNEPHHARGMAEGFGEDPEQYDRARPRYPQAMADRILATIPGRQVLDVGIGTGIAARPFRAAGCQVLGVDVDARMAEFARQCGFKVEVAKFEEWGPEGRVFDLVIAGQTWHWVDPVAGAAKAADVLRAGGRLAVFWNVFGFPPDLGAAFAQVYQRVLPGSPFFQGSSSGLGAYSALLDKAADGVRSVRAFSEPERWQFDWETLYTRDQWLDQVPTSGGHRQFPAGKLAELLEGIGTAIDAVGGSFTMEYSTVVVTAVKSAVVTTVRSGAG